MPKVQGGISLQPLSILEQKFRIPEQRVKLADRDYLLKN